MTAESNHRIPKSKDDNRRLCRACTSNDWLRNEIERTGALGSCSFCDKITERGLPLHVVAGFVDQAFEDHFDKTPENPSDWEYVLMKEFDKDWDRTGEEISYVLQEAAGVEEDVAEALREMLADHYYDHEEATMGTAALCEGLPLRT